MSIISGDDVKGNVTLTMKNVPWEQALDSILDVKGLAKKQMGDVISVMTLERKKKDESDKKAAEEDQIKAEDARKARELQILVEKGKLRQILIEAKIVEASEEFVRNLGVQWGFGNQSKSWNVLWTGFVWGNQSPHANQCPINDVSFSNSLDKIRNHRSINDGSSQFPIQCARADFWSCFWRRARLY